MEPLSDELYLEKVRRARAMSGEAKLLAGLQLFEFDCEVMKAGIRHQYPDADEAEVLARLRDRFAIRRRLEAQELRQLSKELPSES
ncbi:MAG TPA: hypothetical protein VMM56_08830 [Planctomycetaceae bacterium]|nr:hypothetical protein [Planctomycetaceae bacterium]